MAEYYAVLSKAVAGLEANSADTRRAVYDKARNALIGQLKAIDPPLPTSEISRQRLELEEAIRRVERETSTVPTGAPMRVAGGRPQAEQSVPRQSPQDVFRRAIQEAERDGGDTPRLERAPAAARVDTSWASERNDRTPPPRQAPAYQPAEDFSEDEPEDNEARLAPDYDYEWDPNAAPKAGGYAADPHLDARDRPAKARSSKRGRGGDDHEVMEQRARPSRLPTILLLVLILAMVGGLGAIAYSQREKISNFIAAFDSGSTTTTEPTTVAAPAADTTGKDTDRLLPGQQAAPADGVRTVSPATDGTDTTTTPDSQLLPQGGTTAATDDAATDSLVAQKAILYEEPLDSASAAKGVVAINAAVTWTFNSKGADGPEVVGNIDVPERGLKIKLAIRQNSDSTLPASHVVEVVINAPASFPGKGIRDVPRVVLKPSEEARGQPLIGASAKVADGFFWIALSGVDTDVTANLRLLKERSWIDLPLVYETGQRAILTFEKGTPGERVFEKALAAWTGTAG